MALMVSQWCLLLFYWEISIDDLMALVLHGYFWESVDVLGIPLDWIWKMMNLICRSGHGKGSCVFCLKEEEK